MACTVSKTPLVMRRLVELGVTLTVCPYSNVRLGVFATLDDVPLRALLDAGIAVTINSDDPTYFGGYIADNFRGVSAALQLNEDDLYRLSAYAIGGCFAETSRKFELMAELDRVFDDFEAGAAPIHL